MGIGLWFPLRKCGKLVAVMIFVASVAWYSTSLKNSSTARRIRDELHGISDKSQMYLNQVGVLTRRLNEISQKWTEMKMSAKELSRHTANDRKLLIWGIGESDHDENTILTIFRDTYEAFITSRDVEMVERVGDRHPAAPRPVLVHFTNEFIKRNVMDLISLRTDLPATVDDRKIDVMMTVDDKFDQSCTMRIKGIDPPVQIARMEDVVGAVLMDTTYDVISNATNEEDKQRRRDARVWIANKDTGNRILLQYESVDSFRNGGTPSANFTLPYAWAGTGHVVISGCLFYVRAKSNYIVKYDLNNKKMVRNRQIRGARFTGSEPEEEGCPYESGFHSDITLQADEIGLWATYCSSKGGSTNMKLALLDTESLNIRKQWDTKWRKDWFEAAFVVCGVAYAVRKFESRPYLQIKYAFNTMTSLPLKVPTSESAGVNVDPQSDGRITHLSYDRIDKRLLVWTDKGKLLSMSVKFDFIKEIIK